MPLFNQTARRRLPPMRSTNLETPSAVSRGILGMLLLWALQRAAAR